MRKRIKENNPTYNCIKRNKIPRNKFNQGGENLYSENCKILMKQIENDTDKWEAILCSWNGRSNVVKISILPKAV